MQVNRYDAPALAVATSEYIYSLLGQMLTDGNSGLLLSGGSVTIEIGLALKHLLVSQPLINSRNLTVGILDERFGKPWHSNSNMLLLKQTGLLDVFESFAVTFIPPLSDLDTNLLSAAMRNEELLTKLFSSSSGRIVGVFGLGSDGHTAGLKPQRTPEEFTRLFMGLEWVAGYKADDFERLTITPAVISKILNVVVYAKGETKKPALQKMLTGVESEMYTYPAIIFKNHPHTTLFTDQTL